MVPPIFVCLLNLTFSASPNKILIFLCIIFKFCVFIPKVSININIIFVIISFYYNILKKYKKEGKGGERRKEVLLLLVVLLFDSCCFDCFTFNVLNKTTFNIKRNRFGYLCLVDTKPSTLFF